MKPYLYEYNGKLYVRASHLSKDENDFIGIPEEVIKAKGNIGTLVHKAIDDEINGKYPYVPIEFMEKTNGYIESFRRWRDKLQVQFVETSKRYFCEELMLTGELDALICFVAGGTPMLIDFKTSANESPRAWTRQGHFYHYLLETNGKAVKEKICFIKLNKDGLLPKVIEYKYDINTRNWCIAKAKAFWEAEKNCEEIHKEL